MTSALLTTIVLAGWFPTQRYPVSLALAGESAGPLGGEPGGGRLGDLHAGLQVGSEVVALSYNGLELAHTIEGGAFGGTGVRSGLYAVTGAAARYRTFFGLAVELGVGLGLSAIALPGSGHGPDAALALDALAHPLPTGAVFGGLSIELPRTGVELFARYELLAQAPRGAGPLTSYGLASAGVRVALNPGAWRAAR